MWDGNKMKVTCGTRADTFERHLKLSLQKNLATVR